MNATSIQREIGDLRRQVAVLEPQRDEYQRQYDTALVHDQVHDAREASLNRDRIDRSLKYLRDRIGAFERQLPTEAQTSHARQQAEGIAKAAGAANGAASRAWSRLTDLLAQVEQVSREFDGARIEAVSKCASLRDLVQAYALESVVVPAAFRPPTAEADSIEMLGFLVQQVASGQVSSDVWRDLATRRARELRPEVGAC